MALSLKGGFLACLLLTTICTFLYAYSYIFVDPSNNMDSESLQSKKTVASHGEQEYTCRDKIRHGTDFTVIYNAMPKAGSRTFSSISRTVILENNKKRKSERRAVLLSSKFGGGSSENTTMLKESYETLRKKTNVIRGHNIFVQLPSRRYVCMNIIREPIPWILTSYYYAKNGDGGRKLPRNVSQTYDECISNNPSSCIPSVSAYLRYFCGDLPECYTDDALNISKTNLDRFLVVGLTEEYSVTMRIIERLMPDVFGGLVVAYNQNSEGMRERSRTAKKQEPTEATMETLRTNPDVIMMYDFYEYVKQRFEQLRTCLFDH